MLCNTRCAQPAIKGSFLLQTWAAQAETVRANGFSPKSEAVGNGAFKMKALADELPKLKAQASIIGLCEKGQMSFETLKEPHATIGARLSRTKLMAALSAGAGSAVAFVSEWDDHICVDACVVNPSYMGASEEAELALLQKVATNALADGKADVRLRASYQIEGDAFYARAEFFPIEGETSNAGAERVLRYKPNGATGSPVVASLGESPAQ
jgi:hypothetical protein